MKPSSWNQVQKKGVLSDVRGLDSVEACLLPRTGEACLRAAVSDPFMGEPSGEDSISSITGGIGLSGNTLSS